MTVTSKYKDKKVGNEWKKKRIDKDSKQLSDSYTVATTRICHYILLKHKSNTDNKEAILWSACFNVPLR